MYQGSPRTSIPDMRGLATHHSPQKGQPHHQSNQVSVQNQLLSPSHSRRTQGSGASSPLTVACDNIQYGGSMYNMPYNNQALYIDHGRPTSPVPSSTASSRTTPFQSPAHSRSTSMTGMKNLLRDRSVERVGNDYMSPGQGGPMVRDRSLDRQLDRHAYVGRKDGRDRSLDREFMAARTLDRDTLGPYTRVRHGSLDHEYLVDHGPSPTSSLPSHMGHQTNDSANIVGIPQSQSLLLDFQSDIANLNHECAKLQQELDLTKEKLSSTMNSIKTFWSPELKKERALRKEESSRYSHMAEQLRTLSSEKQVSHFLNILVCCSTLQLSVLRHEQVTGRACTSQHVSLYKNSIIDRPARLWEVPHMTRSHCCFRYTCAKTLFIYIPGMTIMIPDLWTNSSDVRGGIT